MAKKSGSKGNLNFDFHSLTSEQKQKLTSLSEQFPELPRDHVAVVLSYCVFDSDKAVNSLTADGGFAAVHSYMKDQNNQVKQNSRNKKKNKKKAKKDDGTLNFAAVHGTDADDSSSLHSSNIDFDGERESTSKLNCDVTNVNNPSSVSSSDIVSQPPCESSTSNTIIDNLPDCPERPCSIGQTSATLIITASGDVAVKPAKCDSPSGDSEEKAAASTATRDRNDEPIRHSSQKVSYRQRHGSSHHSKSSPPSDAPSGQTSNMQKKGCNDHRTAFTKCKKDLNRQTVSLQRINSQLGIKLDEANKSLKNAFNEIRQKLQDRQNKLEEELEKVRSDAVLLLKSRQDLAAELKIRADRNLSDSEWNDLRADIKQFVTERKYDDELGKTVWFYWSPDEIDELITKFGEVCPVKNTYSQRHFPRAQDSSEPSSPHSGNDDSLSTAANTVDAKTISSADASNEVEVKSEKDIPAKSTIQGGENRSRVFSNRHFSHNQSNYGGRFQHPRARGNFSRGQGHMGNAGPRMWQQYGREHNNYKHQQYHHMDYHVPGQQNKPGENPLNGSEACVVPRYMGRENQGHYRDRRPYGNRPERPYNNNYRRPRGAGRPPRQYNDGMQEKAIDKNANYNSENKQSSEEMVNGY